MGTLADADELPQTIVVFRDGVADGQIEELFTKEVVGIQRAIAMFREKYKLKKWKPKLEYLLCNKNTWDRFGLLDQKTGLARSLNKPCVVYDHVLSDRLWDFIIFPYHYKKNADRTKGVRYIVLHDDLKLAKHKTGAVDLFQFIFGLTYMFAFSVPFPLGGGAQPAPICYAKHYAELSSQQILNSDKRIEDLAIHEHLRTRPHVITQSIFAQPPQPETTTAPPPQETNETTATTTEPAQAQGEAAHWQPKVKPQQQQKVVCSEGVAAPPPPPQQLVNNENAEDLAN